MKNIKISGYKSIKAMDLDLMPINILIGSNGSGKSNFLSFFVFISRFIDNRFSQFIEFEGGINKFLFNGIKNTDKLSFNISFEKCGYAVDLYFGKNEIIINSERLIFNGKQDKEISLGNKSQLKSSDNYREKNVKEIIENIENFKKYHFHDTSYNSAFTHLSHIENDIYYLYDNGANLIGILYNIFLKNKRTYDLILYTIQSIAPYFQDFYFAPNEGKYLKFQWKSKHSDTLYGVNDLSSGTLRFIAITVLFLQPNPPQTIIIDEPELGLHPFAIDILSGMIKSIATRGKQVIISTQSADLISYFKPEQIVTVDLVNGESKFERLSSKNLKEWLKKSTIDELWKSNVIETAQPF